MKIDPQLFLKALGSSLPEDPAKRNNSKPIHCRCPLHAGEDSMTIMCSPTGNMTFKCADQTCKFNGDAVALLCSKFKVSIKSAVDMLRPGGMLAACMTEPMRSEEAEAYIGKANTQLQVKAYLTRCQQLLARNPSKCRIRPGLSQSSMRLIPPEIGLLEINDDMPEAFSEFRKPKYRKSNLITFPYTYNGDVTHVVVIDADNPACRYDISIIRPDFGVFGEEALCNDDIKHIVVMSDPIAASVFYGTLQSSMSRRAPVVAVSGFPLPHSFSGVADVVLLEFSDSRISLDYMLGAIESDDIVEGEEVQPKLKVYSYRYSSRDAKQELFNFIRIMGSHSTDSDDGVSIEYAVAKEINKFIEAGKKDEVLNILKDHPLSAHAKESIAVASNDRMYDSACLDILKETSAYEAGKLVLGNKKVLISTPTSLTCLGSMSASSVLTNFGIRVDKRVRGEDTDYLDCLITPDDKTVMPVSVHIPEKVWHSHTRIRSLISNAFAETGQTPYIAMYDAQGVSWYDVMSKLAEGCKVRKNIDKLGVDDVRDVIFPNVLVSTRTSEVKRQENVINASTYAIDRYSGLKAEPVSDFMLPFKLLAEKCDNIEVGAFMSGLCHALGHQIVHARNGKPNTNKAKHLFFVDTEPGCFDAAFNKLNLVFTDDPVAEISSSAPVKSISKYKSIGSLPLICKIPRIDNTQRLINAIDDVDFPIIGLVDSYTASMLNGRISAVYVTPSDETDRHYSIQPKTVIDVRNAFPYMLLKLCNDGRLTEDLDDGLMCTRCYNHLGKILNVPTTKLMHNMCSKVFAGAGMSGVDSFFEKLHLGMVGIGKMSLCVVYGKPQDEHSFTKRGQHLFVLEDKVLIGKYVVDLVNKYSRNVFSVEQLDAEMYEREMLVRIPDGINIDSSRCWCIPRDIFDERIARKPLNLEKIVQ